MKKPTCHLVVICGEREAKVSKKCTTKKELVERAEKLATYYSSQQYIHTWEIDALLLSIQVLSYFKKIPVEEITKSS